MRVKMQPENKIFDDIARVAGGAASALGSLKDQIRNEIRHRVDSVIANMDMVRREEFDAVSAMAAKARLEQEALEKRVAVLEAKLGIKAPTKKTTAKKTAAKKPAAKKPAAKKAAPKKKAAAKTTAPKAAAKTSKTKSAATRKKATRSKA